MTAAGLRQLRADLLASFWLRPAALTSAAIALSALLVRAEGAVELPDWLAGWVYAGGTAGARDVLGVVAGATIGVAGTTFSITVAALTLASNQMGPRLLRNFTRDAGNQYALGTLVATFAYALVALRSVHEGAEENFVPQLAVSGALVLAIVCVAVLIWFLHHVATSISVDHVVALVHRDLAAVLARLPEAESGDAATDPGPSGDAAPLVAPAGGYLRVLDDDALADWAAAEDGVLRLRVKPGGYVFAGSVAGTVTPARLRAAAQTALDGAMSLGETRNVEQDPEYAVRQLVEIGLRALSPGINDPFSAIAVLDHLGSALCGLAGRRLPTGRIERDGRPRLLRPVTDYDGLLDAMFHMLRQNAATNPPVAIRLLEVLAEIHAVEREPARRGALRRHAAMMRDAALDGTQDATARAAIAGRFDAVGGPEGSGPPARQGA